MAGIKVDPPPIMVRVVDDNGYASRELKEYLYRLWERTSNPAGNLLDRTSNQANNAQEIAETSIQLSGNATQQLQQLAALQVALQTTTNQHINANEAHGSNGDIVGFNDAAMLNKVGLVLKAKPVTLPGNTTATTSATVIELAPAAYNQAHYQTVVDLLNSRTAQLNQLITDYNQLTTQLAAFKQALVDAGIM